MSKGKQTPRPVLEAAAEQAIRYREEIAAGKRSRLRPYGSSFEAFQEALPDEGAKGEDVIADLASRALPGIMPMTGSRFFGWVIGSSHPVGVAADWLTSAWGQNAGNHMASPSAAAAETVAAGWLLELLDLPRSASVGFVTGATLANFVCLAAARNAVLGRAGWDVEAQGLFGAPPINVVIGDDAHTTVFSALQFLGLGHDRVIRVAADDQGRILVGDFKETLSRAQGPTVVVLQAGQLNTGAFDDFRTLIPIAKAAGAWVHVDGAFGLWARVPDELKAMADGVDAADSWATDGHKWLQTPYDCGYAIVRDSEAHRRAMTIAASYLPPAAENERDPSHFVPELSRRARGFATWALIKHFGRQGIEAMIRRHCRCARMIADKLRAEPTISILNDVVLNQVLVRFGGDLPAEDGDRVTRETIAQIQSDGALFAGGAKWRGRQVMRLSVISDPIEESDAMGAVDAILSAARKVRSGA